MRINKYIKISLFVIALSLLGCSDYVDTEIESPIVDNAGVSFANENATSYELQPGENAFITLKVKRSQGGSAIDVPIQVVTNTDDAFIVPASVSFAAGETSKDLVVRMSPTAPAGTPLKLQIAFDENYVNPYLASYGDYSGEVLLLNWIKYSVGTYTAAFFGSSWEQELFQAEGTNRFRFFDLYAEGYHYTFLWEKGETAIEFLETPNADGYIVQESGYVHASYGMVSTFTDPSPNYTKYDSATNTFIFDRQWNVSAGSFGWQTDTYKITQEF